MRGAVVLRGREEEAVDLDANHKYHLLRGRFFYA